MLDYNDYLNNFYIKNIENFIKYPETGFMITKGKIVLCKELVLSRSNVEKIFYNNYIPHGCD